MLINSLALWEGLQADPADVRATMDARHVVTTVDLLDHGRALRTFLDVSCAGPNLEWFIYMRLILLARNSFVILNMAVGADLGETNRALENSVWWPLPVDLWTVGGRAVKEFVRVRMDM